MNMNYSCNYRVKRYFGLATAVMVVLTISTAVSQAQHVVPEVSTLELSDAGLKIDLAELLLGTVTYECHDTVPKGAVIKQDPAAGAVIDVSIPVDVVVSTGECDADCGYPCCPINWRALFLGGLAVLVLIILAIAGLSGGGDIISPIHIFK